MGLFSSKKTNTPSINWIKLSDVDTVDQIKQESFEQPVLIFKHSTRCSISSGALDRLNRNWKESLSEKVKTYYLDLIAHREISNKIAETFEQQHQSPQALIIKDGKCTYNQTHFDIQFNDIQTEVLQ